MTKTNITIVTLFIANCTVLIWMRMLPGGSNYGIDIDTLLSQKSEQDGLELNIRDAPAKDFVNNLAIETYRSRYRQHRLVNTLASTVLFLDTCFVFVVGIWVCVNRQARVDDDIGETPPNPEVESGDATHEAVPPGSEDLGRS